MKEAIKILISVWIAIALTLIAIALFNIEASLNFPKNHLKSLGVEHPLDYLKNLENSKSTP